MMFAFRPCSRTIGCVIPTHSLKRRFKFGQMTKSNLFLGSRLWAFGGSCSHGFYWGFPFSRSYIIFPTTDMFGMFMLYVFLSTENALSLVSTNLAMEDDPRNEPIFSPIVVGETNGSRGGEGSKLNNSVLCNCVYKWFINNETKQVDTSINNKLNYMLYIFVHFYLHHVTSFYISRYIQMYLSRATFRATYVHQKACSFLRLWPSQDPFSRDAEKTSEPVASPARPVEHWKRQWSPNWCSCCERSWIPRNFNRCLEFSSVKTIFELTLFEKSRIMMNNVIEIYKRFTSHRSVRHANLFFVSSWMF